MKAVLKKNVIREEKLKNKKGYEGMNLNKEIFGKRKRFCETGWKKS